ncbi:leucine-rich repeat-containing protein 18-like [Rana temporaria]|uniref:leucine-rich repeat-containing protein 18-like n=1 Tax=Rana temporaria TaxID=8407 RepID=UPI001AACA7B0|nr:leucine-rich repeat-containing protein 18-like [Rana temporaria]
MPKRKRARGGKRINLKAAKKAIRITIDGKKRLDLSKREISSFPKCLLKLLDVVELDLSRNFIKKVPNWIEKFQDLRLLDLHSNQIKNLPGSIGHLQNLHFLNVSNNKLTEKGIPMELNQLKKLRQLNLGLNAIDVLPTSIGALKDLEQVGLFDNNLTKVPPGVLELPKLKKLNTERNPILPTKEELEAEQQEAIQRVGNLHLVNEKYLCKPCVAMCHGEKSKLNKRKSLFTNLVTPNSTSKKIKTND